MNILIETFNAKPIFTISALAIILVACALWGWLIVAVVKSNIRDREYWERIDHYRMTREQWLRIYHKKQWKREFKNVNRNF